MFTNERCQEVFSIKSDKELDSEELKRYQKNQLAKSVFRPISRVGEVQDQAHFSGIQQPPQTMSEQVMVLQANRGRRYRESLNLTEIFNFQPIAGQTEAEMYSYNVQGLTQDGDLEGGERSSGDNGKRFVKVSRLDMVINTQPCTVIIMNDFSQEYLKYKLHKEKRINEKTSLLNSVVNHQVVLPLFKSISICENLLLDNNLHSRLRREVLKVLSAQKLAHLMSNDLLDFQTQKDFFRPKEKRCRPYVLLLEVHSLLETEIKEKDIKLETSISDACKGFIIADGQRIQQIYLNLLMNAIAFSVRHMFIIVTAEISQNSNQVDELVIRIQDRGCGIPEQDLKKIFKPFF